MTSSVHNFDSREFDYQKGRHGEAFNTEAEPSRLTWSLVTGQEDLDRSNHNDFIHQLNIESNETADVARKQGWRV